MIRLFGGIGLTEDEIIDMSKNKDLEELDELLILLDPLYCEEEE